jgi:hypothetical protein
MKIARLIIGWFTGLLAAASVQAQGTFKNLNFEDANPVVVIGSPYYPYGVTVASALPYWSVSYGTVEQTDITYNDPALGSPWVNLIGPGGAPGFAPIDGNYSVLLQGGVIAPETASISQTGEIPVGTESLLFKADAGTGSLNVLIGSQVIPFFNVGTGPNYTLYGANVSAWAGDTEQLTFSAFGPTYNNWLIDDISFSTSVVPEPGPIALAAIGGLLFALYRRFAPTPYPQSQAMTPRPTR